MKTNQSSKPQVDQPPVGLPNAVLDLLRLKWDADPQTQQLFDWVLKLREDRGRPTLCASSYLIRSENIGQSESIFSFKELKKLIADDALPQWGYEVTPNLVRLNEHVGHSLVQFCSRVMAEWDAHQARLDKLRLTPHGRIRSKG